MSATQKPAGNTDESEKSLDGQFPPVPDEDGPHDVPDEKVIEKTMPTKPHPDEGSSRPS